MTTTRQAVALLLLLVAGATQAEDLSRIPKWHMVGNEACYGFDDAKTLVLLDQELKLCDTSKQTVVDLKLSIQDLQSALAKDDQAVKTVTSEATNLKAQLATCIDARAAAEAKAASGPSAGWLVAGGLVLTLVGWVAGAYLIH